ncbi:MAG TPA: hypothetical protein VHP14_16350 [Anaerolineales bacterium]|nr:hypothetical protein [Anaerolineales bacterium]
MAKRAKDPKDSNHETGVVKIVDPFYDAPEVIHAEAEPPSQPPRPSFGQRVRRFFDFLLRLIATLIILGVIGLGLYYGLPLLYQKYIVPVEQNTANVTELQSWQEQTDKKLDDLQSRLDALETEQEQHTEALTELDGRVGDLETEIDAHTKSLEALEQMQSELQAQDKATSAELQSQINILKAMELLSRARLYIYQSNYGLAKQDIQIARDLLAEVDRNEPNSSTNDLNAVIRRLDLVLSDLPNFPVAASDDLDIAWQILLSGLPQTGPTPGPTPAPTFTPTAAASVTPTAEVTVEPTATQ